MDDRRFDELSKHLGTGLSRKGILRLLGGVGAAGLAASGLLQAADAKKKGKNKKRKKKHKNGGSGASQEGASGCHRDQDCQVQTCKTATCNKDGTCSYTPIDGRKGPKCASSGKICCKGECKSGDTCCTPKTCKDVEGKCGDKIPDGCGGTIRCDCPDKECQDATCDKDGNCKYTSIDGKQGPECHDKGEICCAGKCKSGDTCCTPKTCKDVEGKCGDKIPDGCGGTIRCDCPDKECQDATCDKDGNCKYTSIDGKQGPECHDKGEICCAGKCKSGDTCCTPKTCKDVEGKCGDKIPDGCGGTIRCDCPDKECQDATCDKDGNCKYTPIDGKQGPECHDKGEICCAGKCKSGDTCCTPKTCKDVEGKCGDKIPDGCGGTIRCDCPDKECQAATCVGDKCKYTPIDGEQGPECNGKGDICCSGKCVKTDTLCGGTCSNACEDEICQTASCVSGKCKHTPVENGEPGPLCDEAGDFCCNGDCCEAGDVCTGEGCCTPKTCAVDYAGQCGTFPQGCGLEDVTCECTSGHTCNPQGICVDIPSCVPVSIEEACSGLHCGPASNGCGVDYECGTCGKKKKKGQRPIKQGCVAGVCKPFKKKRCFGSGLAGQKCSNKCKCKNGRKCNNGRCCEDVGDGSRHCNSNSECCPGLVCAYRRPGQHRVCMPRNAKDLSTESTETTAAPGVAIGAILTGLAATMGAKLTGNGEPASVAMDEVQIHALGPRD